MKNSNQNKMSPAEEAELLIFQYYDMFEINLENSIAISEAQACALVAVKRIQSEMSEYTDRFDCTETFERCEYWNQVEEEIKKYDYKGRS